MGLLGHETFVPQSYRFGDEAQVDWYEGWVEFDGEARKTYVFCLRSMASGGAFHRAYPHANQQAFLERTVSSPLLQLQLPYGLLPSGHKGKKKAKATPR